MIVAIHQPNYLPWLGYFHKIAQADVFVFLDDVQFSKNGYINRVRILANGTARWLTVPVSVHLGDAINAVYAARADWRVAHLDTLKTFYGGAAAFAAVWPRLREIYAGLPADQLAASNRVLIERVAGELGLRCRFLASSEIDSGAMSGDDRLVRIVAAVAANGTYLSGKGGASYQDPDKFGAAGLGFRYTDFHHPVYDQGPGNHAFVPGLSAVDPVFRLGWSGAAELLGAAVEAA